MNEVHTKPNVFWGIITFPLVRIIIAIIFIEFSIFILRSISSLILSAVSIQEGLVFDVIIFVVRVVTAYFAYILFVKIFERRRASELVLDNGSITNFGYGALFGFVFIALVMGIVWILGYYRIVSVNPITSIIPAGTFQFFSAINQDILFFGVIFRITEESLGSWIAIAVASILFGVIHLAYADYTLWNVITIALEGGVLFSALYILTRRLWIIIGFHFVWNFIQYGIFGTYVVEPVPAPLFNSKLVGPDVITGGLIGPDGSIITLILGICAGMYLLMKAGGKGKLIVPFWK